MILIFDRSSVRRELPMNNLQQNHPVVDRFRALPNPSQLIFSELGRHKNDKTCRTDRNCSERNTSGCLKWEGAILQATAEDPFQILPVSDSTHLCQAAPLLFSPKQLPYFPRRHQGQKNKSAGPQPANAPSHIHSWTTHFLYIHESSRNKKWFSGSLPSWITKIMIKKHDLHFEKKTPIPPKHLHGEFGALQMSSNISGTSVCSGSLPIYQEMHVSCSSATSIKSK